MKAEIIRQSLDRATACALVCKWNEGRFKDEFRVIKQSKGSFKIIKEILPSESFYEKREMSENAKKHLKEIVYLREIECLSYRVIAERYPFTESTVRYYYESYKRGCYELEEGE